RRSIARTFHRHIAQIILESRKDSCVKFMQSDGKICIALKRLEFLEVPDSWCSMRFAGTIMPRQPTYAHTLRLTRSPFHRTLGGPL
ncbi:MAG: hypothetical protein IKN72_12870, partial [Clostridia bacterium]|nr:hypothetical protein [Clostridia bacterium]